MPQGDTSRRSTLSQAASEASRTPVASAAVPQGDTSRRSTIPQAASEAMPHPTSSFARDAANKQHIR